MVVKLKSASSQTTSHLQVEQDKFGKLQSEHENLKRKFEQNIEELSVLKSDKVEKQQVIEKVVELQTQNQALNERIEQINHSLSEIQLEKQTILREKHDLQLKWSSSTDDLQQKQSTIHSQLSKINQLNEQLEMVHNENSSSSKEILSIKQTYHQILNEFKSFKKNSEKVLNIQIEKYNKLWSENSKQIELYVKINEEFSIFKNEFFYLILQNEQFVISSYLTTQLLNLHHSHSNSNLVSDSHSSNIEKDKYEQTNTTQEEFVYGSNDHDNKIYDNAPLLQCQCQINNYNHSLDSSIFLILLQEFNMLINKMLFQDFNSIFSQNLIKYNEFFDIAPINSLESESKDVSNKKHAVSFEPNYSRPLLSSTISASQMDESDNSTKQSDNSIIEIIKSSIDKNEQDQSNKRFINYLKQNLKTYERNELLLLEQNKVLQKEIIKLENNVQRYERLTNLEYLKNILLKFFKGEQNDQMVVVLSDILKLTNEEIIIIREHIRNYSYSLKKVPLFNRFLF